MKDIEEMDLRELYELKAIVKDISDFIGGQLQTYSVINNDGSFTNADFSIKSQCRDKSDIDNLMLKINLRIKELVFNSYVK